MGNFKRRWNDKNEKHIGPLTFCWDDNHSRLGFMLDSGGEEDGQPGCHARLHLHKLTILCELPQIIKPHRSWVDTSRYDVSKPPHGYWKFDAVEYGVNLFEDAVHVRYGRQTHDSDTEKSKCYFLPWRQWRQISHVVFSPDGTPSRNLNRDREGRWSLIDDLQKTSFEVEDFDGTLVTVETYIEERIWRRGEGWLRWLGYVTPRRRKRSMEMRFLSEVGPEKGSWKGCMIGCGIEMRSEETSEQAMRRFCDEEHRSKSGKYKMKLIGAAPAKIGGAS